MLLAILAPSLKLMHNATIHKDAIHVTFNSSVINTQRFSGGGNGTKEGIWRFLYCTADNPDSMNPPSVQ